jgi:hypothetical protein
MSSLSPLSLYTHDSVTLRDRRNRPRIVATHFILHTYDHKRPIDKPIHPRNHVGVTLIRILHAHAIECLERIPPDVRSW